MVESKEVEYRPMLHPSRQVIKKEEEENPSLY